MKLRIWATPNEWDKLFSKSTHINQSVSTKIINEVRKKLPSLQDSNVCPDDKITRTYKEVRIPTDLQELIVCASNKLGIDPTTLVTIILFYVPIPKKSD